MLIDWFKTEIVISCVGTDVSVFGDLVNLERKIVVR